MIVRRGKLISRTALWASHIVVISWTGNTGPPTTPHLVHEVHHTTPSIILQAPNSCCPLSAAPTFNLNPLFSFCFSSAESKPFWDFCCTLFHTSTLSRLPIYPSTRLPPLLCQALPWLGTRNINECPDNILFNRLTRLAQATSRGLWTPMFTGLCLQHKTTTMTMTMLKTTATCHRRKWLSSTSQRRQLDRLKPIFYIFPLTPHPHRLLQFTPTLSPPFLPFLLPPPPLRSLASRSVAVEVAAGACSAGVLRKTFSELMRRRSGAGGGCSVLAVASYP